MQQAARNNEDVEQRVYVFNLFAYAVEHSTDSISHAAPNEKLKPRACENRHERLKGNDD